MNDDIPAQHWISEPATSEQPAAGAPKPKRRFARTFAAAVAAAVIAGFSGYAVGHVTADDSSSSATSTDDTAQQGFPGGQPPSGDMGTPPSDVPSTSTGTDDSSSATN